MNDVIEDGNTLPPGSPEEAAVAFALIEPEVAALDEGSVAAIDVDIPRAVVTVLSAWPDLLALRPRLLEELPSFPLGSIDKLETYALAAWYAHLLSLPEVPAAYASLVEEAAALRSRLLMAAEALAHSGIFDMSRIDQIRSAEGDVDMANGLVMLATLFANAWDAADGRTVATKDEVERAASLGSELVRAMGVREQVPPRAPAQIADQRMRAFTLLARAYDDCRRAVTYLRGSEGDASEIAPSLFGNVRGAAKSEEETVDAPPVSGPRPSTRPPGGAFEG